MNETRDSIVNSASLMWANTLSFLPKLGLFLIILIAGYFIAKAIGNIVARLLDRLHFNRLVERSGIHRALARSNLDASHITAKIVFYALVLFVVQLAFAVFGQNPVSDLLNRVIAFLPTLFVALAIVVVSGLIAKAVKETLLAVFGGLSYGRTLANIAGAAILIVGTFAALSHLQIAPAIVNGLFYAALAIVAGSAVVAIGGGGILPMRRQWDKAISKVEAEAPRLRAHTQGASQRVEARAEELKERVKSEMQSGQTEQQIRERQGQRYEPKERGRDRM